MPGRKSKKGLSAEKAAAAEGPSSHAQLLEFPAYNEKLRSLIKGDISGPEFKTWATEHLTPEEQNAHDAFVIRLLKGEEDPAPAYSGKKRGRKRKVSEESKSVSFVNGRNVDPVPSSPAAIRTRGKLRKLVTSGAGTSTPSTSPGTRSGYFDYAKKAKEIRQSFSPGTKQQCPFCSASFRDNPARWKHMSTTHRQELFEQGDRRISPREKLNGNGASGSNGSSIDHLATTPSLPKPDSRVENERLRLPKPAPSTTPHSHSNGTMTNGYHSHSDDERSVSSCPPQPIKSGLRQRFGPCVLTEKFKKDHPKIAERFSSPPDPENPESNDKPRRRAESVGDFSCPFCEATFEDHKSQFRHQIAMHKSQLCDDDSKPTLRSRAGSGGFRTRPGSMNV